MVFSRSDRSWYLLCGTTGFSGASLAWAATSPYHLGIQYFWNRE
jgi:hypothetical protein